VHGGKVSLWGAFSWKSQQWTYLETNDALGPSQNTYISMEKRFLLFGAWRHQEIFWYLSRKIVYLLIY
jgi:hypothetical protein